MHKTIIKYIILLFVLLTVTGCQNSNMEDINWDSVRIMTDDVSGKKYMVRHHIGNTYVLVPIYKP